MKVALAFLPLALAVLWNVLDCNPSLFLYDLLLSTVMPVYRYKNIVNKVVWVTGASSGIGAEIVFQLAEAQAGQVILSARRQEKMEQVVKQCKKLYPDSPTTFYILPYDAFIEDASAEVVRKALTMVPSVDIMVLNSGIYQTRLALETSRVERQRIMRVNYEAPVELSLELMQQDGWKGRGYGHLVVVASVMATFPQSLCSTYVASKAALRNYFRSLSTEEFMWLTVNMVLPGGTRTDLWSNLDYKEGVKADIKMLMPPDRVARLLLTGVAGPYWLFYEMWITQAYGLLYTYLSMYTPNVFHLLTHLVGSGRRFSFEQSRIDQLNLLILVKNTGLALLQ